MFKYLVTIWFDSDPEPYKREVFAYSGFQAYALALQDARMGAPNGRFEPGAVIKSTTERMPDE